MLIRKSPALPILLLLFQTTLTSEQALGQDQNQDTQSRLMLTTGGPIGTVRALAFSPSGNQLFSAGIDKCVREWQLVHVGSDQQIRANYSKELRWDIARGPRGAIYTMEVSPDGKSLACAGFSAMDSYGDIAVHDLTTGQLAILQGHQGLPVRGLSFSPNSQRLASSTANGEVRLWDLNGSASRVLREAGDYNEQPHPILFLSDSEVATPERRSSGRVPSYGIVIYDVSRDPPRRRALGQVHAGRVYAMARDPNSSRWASSDAVGNLFIWSGAHDPQSKRLREGRIATSLAFANEDALFASTLRRADVTPYKDQVAAKLEMWSLRRRRLVQEITTAEGQDNHACAVTHNGNYVATFASDRCELWLWPLKDANGRPYREPLADSRLVRIHGAGRAIWRVAFDKDEGYRLGLGTQMKEVADWTIGDYSSLSEAFDLSELKPSESVLPVGQWRSAEDGSNGWKLDFLGGIYNFDVWRGNQKYATIELDPDWQGRMRCYCWLADDRGSTFGLAVGTDHQNGIFVYGLPVDGKCPLLRYFRDHTDWVTSVSASSDGRYLASSSVDQTVKIWSLDDIDTPGDQLKRWHAWGVDFSRNAQADTLSVAALHPAGIAARRKLKEDDEIVSIKYQDRKSLAVATTADEMLRVLEEQPLWYPVLFTVKREGKRRGVALPPVVPGWEPLMTLFLGRKGQWAAWTPQGYYDASVIGDEMFGWQINQLRKGTPEFYRADRFRDELERPEVMKQLLKVGNLPGALRIAQRDVPDDVQDPISPIAHTTPRVSIVHPEHNADLQRSEEIDIAATLSRVGQRLIDGYQLRCYVNGVPAQSLPSEEGDREVSVRWRARVTSPLNRIVVAAERGDEIEAHVFDDVYVRATPQSRKYRLHVVAITGSKYHGELPELRGIQDARRVARTLRDNAGTFYEIGEAEAIQDADVSKESLLSLAGRLKSELGDSSQEDVLLVYIAGHGYEVNGDYYFLPARPDITDARPETIKTHGVPWSVIRRFSDIPCRKLFVIDTCRERVTQSFVTAQAGKAVIRPLRNTEAVVIMAASSGESAQEFTEAYANGPIRIPEGGLFTTAFVRALSGEADGAAITRPQQLGRDGIVDVEEVGSYLGPAIRDLLESALLFGRQQRPFIGETYLGYLPLTSNSQEEDK